MCVVAARETNLTGLGSRVLVDGVEFFFKWHKDLILCWFLLIYLYYLALSYLESHHEEQYNVKWKQKKKKLDRKIVLSLHVGL